MIDYCVGIAFRRRRGYGGQVGDGQIQGNHQTLNPKQIQNSNDEIIKRWFIR